MNDENVTEFAGKPVRNWKPRQSVQEPEKFHYRLQLEYDAKETWPELLDAFLAEPNAARITGLVVGNWGDVATGDSSESVVEALVAARDRLPHLTALFLGDITQEESEISWIVQSDVAPLFTAYPLLEQFRVRGGGSRHGGSSNLRFGALQHDRLKSLVVETGGLPAEPLNDILHARLPSLEHLELWLGTEEYGWGGDIADFAALFQGASFPNLHYLGLRNSEIADDIAAALANAPILQRVRVLDLSLGTLSDEGANTLLQSPFVPQLEKLDVHYHFLSDDMVARLTGALGTKVDASDPQQADEDDGEKWRYVAVGE